MQEYETIPTGDYPIQVVDLTDEEGTFGPQLKWKLEIVGTSEYAGKYLTAWTSLTPSMKGKLAQWAVALGIELEPGMDFDTDMLIGKRAVAVVVVKSKDDGSEFNKVDTIRPPKKAKNGGAKPIQTPVTTVVTGEEEDVFADE